MKILIFGGRGFLGQSVCKALKDHEVYTFDRNSGGTRHIKGNITDEKDVMSALKNKDIIINLVGLSPLKKQDYYPIHVGAVKNIIKYSKGKLIHISALGCESKKTEYLKTKSLAEEIIKKGCKDYTIIAPSLIYDNENELIRLAKKMSITRFFPDIPAKMQPVYRDDLSSIIKKIVERKIRQKRIELGSKKTYTVFDIARLIYEKKNRSCHKIPLPLVKISMNISRLFGILSKDQIINLEIDSTTNSHPYNLKEFSEWIKEVNL